MEKKFKKGMSGGSGGQGKERETTRAFDNKFIGNCLNHIRLVLVSWLGLVSLCHLGCLVSLWSRTANILRYHSWQFPGEFWLGAPTKQNTV